MLIPFLDLKNLHADVKENLHDAAKRVIDSGVYINGPENEALAHELGEKLQLGGVVPVSNGLDALRLITRAYIETGRLQAGDEVILPSNTYIATLLPLLEFGLSPILVKPDPSTFGLDWVEAEKAISPKTKALVTVHLYGTPSWNFKIAKRLREKGIIIIEDNAQAIGAWVREPASGNRIYTGALGDAAAFSFYPTKNIGALGDAGAVATADSDLAKTIKALANYGASKRYHNDYAGYNCRMDEMQAAFLRVMLGKMDEISSRRVQTAREYDRQIVNPAITKPLFLNDMGQVWHQYVIRTTQRDKLRKHLEDNGIATDIHYPLALFNQQCVRKALPVLSAVGDSPEVAQGLSDEILSLPIAGLAQDEIEHVAATINSYDGRKE